MNATLGTKHKAQGTTKGFTLVELSVVLLVIAAVMGSAIALMSAGLTGLAANGTAAKLEKLQQALYDYRVAYNRLPCPANNSVYTTVDEEFGVASDTAGNCSTADVHEATAAVGMVPVRTLGLTDDMAFDGWGRRISYAVAPAFVADDAFDGIAATDTTARLTVTNNDSGNVLTTTGAFVLISHGANGHGAHGGMTGTLVNAGITNNNEHLNCKCDATGAYDASPEPDEFIQGDEQPDPDDPLNNFDDIVVFFSRVDLLDAND